MGNSTCTNQQTKSTSSPVAAVYKRYRSLSQGLHNDDDQQSTSAHTHAQSPITEQITTTAAPHPLVEITATFQPMTNPRTNSSHGGSNAAEPIATSSSPKPVPGRSGWRSSIGASSPWYGGGSSLSPAASPSSHQPYLANYQQQQQKSHRQSISGPYYRARGMSVNQQESIDDDLISSSSSSSTSYQQQASYSLQVHGQSSPAVSSSPPQPPRIQFQQLQLNNPSYSPASSNAFNNSDVLSKEKAQMEPELRSTIITWSQGGDNVYVTGTFNGWKRKLKLVKSTHDFNAVLDLPLGTHRLKFIVDDEWKCSNDLETATDLDGNLVNYIQVLAEDDIENDQLDLLDNSSDDDGNGFISTPTDSKYTSVIPQELLLLSEAVRDDCGVGPGGMDPYQRKHILEWERNQPQPPNLPPHLENVVLNSQTVSDEDSSVLPVPNHVTLNHMYACSIKDHVMALSTTTRYRHKYVTTVYYKPVQ
ncbi:unnamed protein product [Absidia cylindrospora]